MGRLMQDVKFGGRFLAKHPAFAALIILTLGIGIGASSAIFSVVNRVLLQPLPYDDPARLVLIRHDIRNTGFDGAPVPPADVMDFREQINVFEGIATTNRTFEANLTGGSPAEVVRVAGVSHNFFDVLGVVAGLGRTFSAADDTTRAEAADEVSGSATGVVISHGLWQRRFGADEDVVGRELLLNDYPARIIGVMSPEFRLYMPVDAGMPTDIDVWSPAQLNRAAARNSRNATQRIIARMLPGVTLGQAQRQADAVAAWQRETYDYHRDADIHISVTPMRAAIVGHVRPILIGLFAAVGIVLLIACANVAGLLLVQSGAREREIAIRAALGGGRGRIFRQVMTENALLAAAGGLTGLLVARWGVDLLLAARPANLPRLDSVPIDGLVLVFTLVATLVSALLFGAFPALQATKTDLHSSLNDRGIRGPTRRRSILRAALVTGEVALAMVLLVGAGLMTRSLQAVNRVDLGFRPDSALTFRITLPVARYSDIDARSKFMDRLSDAAREHAEISAIGATTVLPLGGQFWTSPYVVEATETETSTGSEANYQIVTPGLFEALGMELVAGRWLSERDDEKRAKVVVVDRELAAKAWPGRSPLGRKLWAEGFGVPSDWYQVVGVVERVHLDDPVEPSFETIFFPYATQGAIPAMNVVVRTTVDPARAAPILRDIVERLDPNVPLAAVRPLRAYVDDASAPVRFATILITLFAGIAVLLSAIGVYGVVSALVRQRTREIGLRLALGAPHPRIVRSIVGRGLQLGTIGLVAGVLASLALTRLIASLVQGVSPSDPLTYVVVGVGLLAVTALASLAPAWRAVRVDPTEALRYE